MTPLNVFLVLLGLLLVILGSPIIALGFAWGLAKTMFPYGEDLHSRIGAWLVDAAEEVRNRAAALGDKPGPQ